MKFLIALLLLPLSSLAWTQSEFDDGYSVKVTSTDTHQIQLIDSNRLALKKRFEWIERAQSSIVVETYYFFPDEGGQVLLKALVEKKKKSPQVSISLLFDSWASNALSPADVHYLTDHGIEVRWFHGNKLFPFGPQRHDHRKTWIFDGSTALIGGFNHASEHMGFSPLYNMVDREVLLEGPIVSSIQDCFKRIWNAAQISLPDDLSAESHVREIESIDLQAVHSTIATVAERFPSLQIHHLSYLSHIRKRFELFPFLKSQVDQIFLSAKRRISIESRFFIPTTSTLVALAKKIHEGIPVHVLTNSNQSILPMEDHFLALGKIFLAQLNSIGARISYFSGKLRDRDQALTESSRKASWGTHSKTYVVDDQTLIGSYNLDPASDYLNLEHFLVVDSAELADQAAHSIQIHALN